jgi:hypothetical protein
MKVYEKYPDLKGQLDALGGVRRDEILADMLVSDSEYIKLRDNRANASMALLATLDGDTARLFEAYSDSLYAHESHELDMVYRQATRDTLAVLMENGLL